MSESQLRTDLWEAAVNAEFFSQQRALNTNLDSWVKIILSLGTIAGLSPLIKDVPRGALSSLSVISTSCGLLSLFLIPAINFPHRIELLTKWRNDWVEVRESILTALRNCQNNQPYETTWQQARAKASEIEIGAHMNHLLHAKTQEKAELEMEKWFRSKGLC